jgi:hypothetical protein
VKSTRKVLAFLMTSFAVVAIAAAAPAAPQAGAPIPATVTSVTAVAAPAATPSFSTTRSVTQTALTAEQLDATRGGGWFSDFIQGVIEGAVTAMIYVVILAIYA